MEKYNIISSRIYLKYQQFEFSLYKTNYWILIMDRLLLLTLHLVKMALFSSAILLVASFKMSFLI